MPGEGVRARPRSVFFYDLQAPDALLGGLVLNPGVTNASFYATVEIVLIIPSLFSLQRDGDAVPRDAQPLLPGNYFIVTDGTVQVNNEQVYTRLRSLESGPRVQSFREQVRQRDGRCVISKLENTNSVYDDWIGFEAAHIFPLAYEQQWRDNNYDRLITLPPSRGGTINLVQNGLLLRGDLHSLFDCYVISINPDDGYKIVCFQPDIRGIAGTCLDDRLLGDPRRPLAQLLRWHFRQAVLTNMRGLGEPIFEHDFPPGSDIMEDIREGPKAAERMEFELFDRLARSMSIYSDDDDEEDEESNDDGVNDEWTSGQG